MKLKTLEEANEQAFHTRNHDYSLPTFSRNTPEPNGIECPKCGSELMDSQPMVILTSDPAQKTTQCSKCDYRGYRFV